MPSRSGITSLAKLVGSGMKDDLNLLWTIISIIGSVLGSVALAAWWLKGQLTSAEIRGLRAENENLKSEATAHATWRQFAEAQVKKLVEELAAAKESQATLQKHIAENADKKVLTDIVVTSSANIAAASSTVQTIYGAFEYFNLGDVREVKPSEQPKRPDVKIYFEPNKK
jgi:hypothetical protein